MGPCFKSFLSKKFDRPETIHDRAKYEVNLVGHRVLGDSKFHVKKVYVEINYSSLSHCS